MLILNKFRLFIRKILGRKNYEALIFFLKNHYWPNLKKSDTFNEKIVYSKLYNKDNRFVKLSDKYKVREYVREKIGENYLTDLYAIYEHPNDFNLRELPEQFVLKANHASGSNFIKVVRSKEKVEEEEIRNWIDWALEQDYGKTTNEWWYNHINPRRIIAEELLNPSGNDLRDYKFFISNGKIVIIQVDQDRFIDHKRNLYNSEWNSLNVKYKYPLGEIENKPVKYAKMKDVAIQLASEFEFSRIDLYLTEDERIIFGEITFAPEAGWGKFKPFSFDKLLGKNLDG